MNNLNADRKNFSGKKYVSLRRSLLFWFLLLALLPLSLTAWFSYRQMVDGLTETAMLDLEHSARLRSQFIQTWFNYRFMDLNSHAESRRNAEFLEALEQGLQKSNKGADEFVKSYDWALLVDSRQQDLITFARRYDYISDIFLIDKDGDILFTVTREFDLGSNLFNGFYTDTVFASTARITLETGKSLFSDFKRNNSSNGMLTSFLTAPILDEEGNAIGLFAIQVQLGRIIELMTEQSSKTSLTHYLVGEDGLARTPVKGTKTADAAVQRIDTQQFKLWRHEEQEQHVQHAAAGHAVFEYPGPGGQQVIGLHQTVKLPGVNWALISEIDRDEALASAHRLGQIIIVMFLLTAVLVGVLAFYLARRITRPVSQLVDSSMKVAEGEVNHQVEVTTRNEIGRLADAFNHMLYMRRMHEQALQQSTERAQQALAELEEQKFALDQHAIVAITDVQGNITFVNEKFSEISGYSREEMIGQNHRVLNSGYHDTAFFREMYRTIARGEVWHDEICNKTKDGYFYWVDTTIVPFMGENGKPKSYIAIRTDITERKRAEEELIEARNIAEDAARAKSAFLASMSHEIRTPMNGVLGMLSLLLNTKLDNDQHHKVTIAQSSAQSLLTLINDILDFSKVDAGKLELEMLDFNLRDMLGEFADAMAHQVQEKGLELVLDVTAVEQSMVKGDPGRLRQILTNLVGNAIKFTSKGEIVIRADMQDYNEQALRLRCTITDTGIGIPAEKLSALFDSFTQVDASTTRKYGGTGLGLAIARKLCELMGGRIAVRSEPGKGSCFELNVVLQKSQQSQLVMPRVDIQALNLLVVDDNITNREVLRGQLEHWGASVVEAEDGPQALAECEQRIEQSELPFFDIAFLDMQMPGMDGEQLGKALKADPRFSQMKLVMMTSMGYQGEARHFADIGFSGYFPKPATTSDLFDALSVVAEDGEALQQARPLVTHHYLKTLSHNKESATENGNSIMKDKPWTENTRVLLVEDNQVNQLVASGILANMGIQVDIAADGLAALNSLNQSSADAPYILVLMDCQMPEMDGYEATCAIRDGKAGENYKSIPIIAMTANAMQGDREKCLEVGMDDYLSKPIEPELLFKKLQQWLPGAEEKTVIEKTAKDMAEPELAVWDKEAALKRIMGDENLLNTIVDVFLNETPTRMDELKQGLEAGDCERIRYLAHTIKGVAGNLSALHLQKQAALMEAAAKETNIEQVSILMPVLEQAIEQLRQRFELHSA
ncbi:MAG TPA: response regulator [Gammaproteobacteria bacterium]|nr:response regulator [Gammaproteobacteria bacterium]